MQPIDPTLRAFHNDPSLKAHYLARIQAHARADEIVQGVYWEDGKGCATGCLMHSDEPHALFPELLGIPARIAYLEDRIFEGLTNPEAQAWARDFLTFIPVGADLALVTPRFMLWLLTDRKHGALRFASRAEARALKQVAALYRRELRGGAVTDAEWKAAAEAAEGGSKTAERAAWGGLYPVRSGQAVDTAASVAEAATGTTPYQVMRDTLVRLLREAPVLERIAMPLRQVNTRW